MVSTSSSSSAPSAARPKYRELHLQLPAIVIHGGAGNYASLTTEQHEAMRLVMGDALDAGLAAMTRQETALEAACAAVVVLEASGLFNAGLGATPTTLGTRECDAAVMDGAHTLAGAVCALSARVHPVLAARAVAVLRVITATPLFLAGAGADLFAHAQSIQPLPSPQLQDLPDHPDHQDHPKTPASPPLPPSAEGTVGAVVVDAYGHVASATSTGGLTGQLPGRVGDSPVVGAGTWADDATAAISATGTGEAFLLAGFAHRIDWSLRAGRTLRGAITAALREVDRWGGSGGVITVTADGTTGVARTTPGMAYGWKDAGVCEIHIENDHSSSTDSSGRRNA